MAQSALVASCPFVALPRSAGDDAGASARVPTTTPAGKASESGALVTTAELVPAAVCGIAIAE
jgi:hypothetical protein